jgi:hypothetical protein
MNTIRVVATLAVLGLLSFACASPAEETAPVTKQFDGAVATSTQSGDVITTTLVASSGDGSTLAVLDWNVANGTARITLPAKKMSVSVKMNGAPATLEGANAVAYDAYGLASKAAPNDSPVAAGGVSPRLLEAFCVSCHAVGQSDICCGWDLWC